MMILDGGLTVGRVKTGRNFEDMEQFYNETNKKAVTAIQKKKN